VSYRESVNPVLAEGWDEKLGRVERLEMKENNYRWENYEEDQTWLMLILGSLLLEDLVLELLRS
jgi:hypothetical protein